MTTLADLIGQESGIVVYDREGATPEAVIGNFAGVNGLPRVFLTGLIGLGELDEFMFDEVKAQPIEDIGLELEGVQIIYDCNDDAESLQGAPGMLWEFDDPSESNTTVKVYAPEGWA